MPFYCTCHAPDYTEERNECARCGRRVVVELEARDERARARLEELRAEIRAERISYGELAELQGLAAYIDPGDVELLEAAGVPERDEEA